MKKKLPANDTSQAIGLDIALELANFITGKSNMHYGIWDELEVNLGNLGIAQEAYTKKLFSYLPKDKHLSILDVGGGATEEQVTNAFKIILGDPNVKGILVNIFGGIMDCDVIANGIVNACKQVNLSIPLVVRLEGNNVDQGKETLSNSGVDVIAADDLSDAAEKAVKAINL